MANDYNNLPPEYRPISMWGYFGYEILFSIPIVGFILLLVFSFGGTKNVNLRNFARSYFCLLILVVIFAIVVAIIGGADGPTAIFVTTRITAQEIWGLCVKVFSNVVVVVLNYVFSKLSIFKNRK